MNTIKVLLADKHDWFRRSLADYVRSQRGFEVVGEVAEGEEAVEEVERLQPDVVLMGISMPRRNGLEATRMIKERWPLTKVVVATMYDDPVCRQEASAAHADGYILKSSFKPNLQELLGV